MNDKHEARNLEQRGGAAPLLSKTDKEILRAVHEVKFGSVEITIHDAKVVQVERREKTRYPDK